MGAAGQQLGLRLFLEGLEVPVVGAQIQIGINSPATASIQVVPGDKIVELKARTMVHLFFWDYTLDQTAAPIPPDADRVAEQYGVTVEEAKTIIADNPEMFATDEQAQLRGYKLLFSGEVIGVVMMKTPAGRQAVLQCSDFSTYWDTTYQFFVSYSPDGNFLGTSAAVWAGSDSLFDDLTAGHTSVMNEYLRSKPQTPGLQNVKGLMGGIISLLEAMGGVPKHTHGINDFFTIAELKNHILQQIVAERNDDTAQRLFDDKAFMDWLTRGMSSLGQLTTFRDMMKLLFKYVYYEVVPNPSAMYVRAKQSQTKTTRVTSTTKLDIPIDLRSALQQNYLAAEQWTVNLFSDQPFDEDKYAKTFKANLRKIAEAKGMPKVYKTKIEKTYTWLDRIKSTEGDNRHIVEVGGTSLPGDPPTTIAPLPSQNFKDNRVAWQKVTDILLEVLDSDIRFSSSSNKVSRTAPELDRLHTQIFRPDCFFAAPPRCNVIFPDQYTQFQFSRNFLQETTRLRLSVDWLFGGDSGGLLAEYHFAPATSDIQKLAKQQGNGGIRALLPWEIYSGILPKFESIHEVNYVAGQAERRRGIKGNIKGAATNYAQRTANFNYMKYRFASRTCEISGKFNPFLVCGFPGTLIERPFILEPQKAIELREKVMAANPDQKFDDMGEFVKTAVEQVGAPTQYLGMIAAIAHSVQQDSGSTSITMTHARTHRITDDDFLNIFSSEISKELETDIVSTILNADELLKKGDYRLLKFLMDATPQDLDKQVQADDDEAAELGDDDNSPGLESRPDGAPSLDNVAVLSQFGSLLTPADTERAVKVSIASKQERGSTYLPIRGRVKKDRLKGTRDTILVPDPGGKLLPGSKGPKGGKIVQIQCVSDAAIGIVGKDTAKRLSSSQKVTLTNSPSDSFTRDQTSGKLTIQGNVIDSSQVSYLWKHVVIHEEVRTSRKVTKLLPIEEGLRPPWFSPLYSNWFIGSEIYEPFFGCGSVVDQALFATDTGAATFGTGRAQQQGVLDQLKAAGNDRKKVLQILDDAKAKKITDVPDIESSVDVLAYIYGEVRRLGLDVHRFVHDYTKRPIATIEDMLGSADLEYELNGDILSLSSGTPGFHSTAIADVGGQLHGLLDNPDLALSRLKKGAGKKAPVSRDLDPRPGRRAKVVEYLEEINASSGSLGVGIAG
jgi:hypothetical protein